MQLPWQHSQRKPDGGPLPALPWPPSATLCLLAVQGVVCLTQLSVRRLHPGTDPLFTHGALSAGGLRAWQLWQPISSLFLTGWNAAAWLLPAGGLALGLAGRPLEAIIGRRHLAQLFLLAGAGGGLAQAGLNRFLENDVPLAGSAAAVAGVLWALACIMPRAALLPGVAWLGRLKVMHAALGVSAAALVGAEHPPGAGILVGCLAGCLYMRGLGFGQRVERVSAPAKTPASVHSPSAPGWSQPPPGNPPLPSQ